jgi:SEC-C motif
MGKIGRNSPCPCGGGEKYKRCCEKKENEMKRRELASGRFRYEPGSYGGPTRGYMSSILCYKETGPDTWTEHFCLVKPDVVLEDEDSATPMAEEHLAVASQAQTDGGGNARDFALSLRHHGYKSISDYQIVKEGP